MNVGSYVQIVEVPASWEGSGEDHDDLEAYVGHVGIVVEVDLEMDLVLLRFPTLSGEQVTGQRNVELSAVLLISAPSKRLPRCCIDG